MALVKLYNLSRMTTPTTGTGTLTLGSAVPGFLSFAAAGVSDGETVTYAISDGAASEIGRGIYSSAGPTLTRSVLKSTNADAPIVLSGSAQVFITVAKEDFVAIEQGKIPAFSNSLTLAGTDGTTHTFPSVSATLAGLGIANVFSVEQMVNLNAAAAPAPPVGSNVIQIVGADGAFARGLIDAFGAGGGWQVRRANGTNASKTQVLSGDPIFNMAGLGYHSGGAYNAAGNCTLRALAEENFTTSAQGTQFIVNTTPTGAASSTSTFRVRHDGSLDVNGAGNTVISAARHHQHRSYAVATLPSAATAGQEIYVSDESGGAVLAFSDGTNWRRVTDRAVVT
ncbi:MAG: hypothetical protein IT537_24625 [Hyphomicrobiales bacterium]|nr:hypothetical protein [Hyphomicrobiales bacterium]